MKKLFSIFAIFVVILVSGCSGTKTLKCSKEMTDDEGYKTTETIEVKYNDKKVLAINQSTLSETDPSYVDLSLGFMSMFTEMFEGVDGIKVEVSKVKDNAIKTSINIDYTKLDIEKLKENFGDAEMEDEMYTSKDITIEDLKEEKLKDYNCK